jgi:peptidoglycan-N-acetylglucosamine deacetylase
VTSLRRWTLIALLAVGMALALTLGAWRLSKSRSYQVFGTLVTRVETQDSVVALTFDDGPAAGYTDSVLAVLQREQAAATFFVIGGNLAAHPALASRIVRSGHELGNHSYSHDHMVLKSPDFIRREVERTDSLIRLTGQRGSILFRPPYGARLVGLPWFLARTHRVTVLWDLEPDSYPEIARDPARIVSHVMSKVRPGSIMLLHVETPSRGTGRAALPLLIRALRAAGYRFTTVSGLLQRQR